MNVAPRTLRLADYYVVEAWNFFGYTLMASGIYFYQIESGSYKELRKMILIQ